MNKKLLATVVVILVLIVGSFVYLMAQDKPESNSPSETTPNTSQEPVANSGTSNDSSTPGAYVDYDESTLAATEGTKILFFYAPWCPQCRALEASINKSTIPSNVTIFKVDYDTNQALRQKYGVTIQTTLVKVDDNGNFVEKYVAYDEPNFETVKENLL